MSSNDQGCMYKDCCAFGKDCTHVSKPYVEFICIQIRRIHPTSNAVFKAIFMELHRARHCVLTACTFVLY